MNKRAVAIKIFGILLLVISIWAAIDSAVVCRKYILQYRAVAGTKSQDLWEYTLNLAFSPLEEIIFAPTIKDIVYVCLFLVFALLNIYSAYGLLRLSRKIRFLSLIICAVFPLFFLYVKFIDHPLVLLMARWPMKAFFSLALLNIFGLILFMLPETKEQFK